MGLNFYARNKQINTADLIFVPNTNQKELNAEGAEQVLTMRAYVDENKYLEFEYKLAPDSYMVNFNINTYNLIDVIASNTNFLTLYWGVDMPQLEKSRDFERRYTGVYYNFSNNDVEHLSLTGDEKVDLPTSVKWVAYKQQFFSSVLIANESFPNVLVSTANNTTPGFLKTADAEISLPYSGKAIEKYDMRFYFGPNSYPTLREYGKDIELPKLVDLGWIWIAWFNRYVVIPIFNFLETNVTLNYGLIIFLLTLIIKLVLFPLTYKSYISQDKKPCRYSRPDRRQNPCRQSHGTPASRHETVQESRSKPHGRMLTDAFADAYIDRPLLLLPRSHRTAPEEFLVGHRLGIIRFHRHAALHHSVLWEPCQSVLFINDNHEHLVYVVQ